MSQLKHIPQSITEQRDQLNNILIDYNRFYLSDKKISEIYQSRYNRQAIDFLTSSYTKIDISHNGCDYPQWQKSSKVNKYLVTLRNSKHTYSFEFFDSIKNTEDNKSCKYDFYSVLACLSYYTPESFDDFCSEFGYEFENESEYIKTKSIHLACLDQQKNIKKLFNDEQLQLLQEIN